MAKPIISTKRLQIDKANARVVIMAGVAAFIVIFCAVAVKTFISQATYQNRVISAKRTAVNQLKKDIASTNTLRTAYDTFNNAEINVLGGNSKASGARDGSNTNIVLDALPSSYDFPALATSLEKLMTAQNLTITSISGTDDEVAQSQNQTSASPQPVPIPFQVGVTGNYASVQGLISTFEHSIRPIQLQTLDVSGDQSAITMSLTAQTYYQPGKSLNITTKVVK